MRVRNRHRKTIPWLLVLLMAFGASDASAGDVYCTKVGHAAAVGTQARPYHVVESAICKAADGDTVHLEAGRYLENFTVSERNVTLTADNGPVHIGIPAGFVQERLKVITYNTHLFGDEVVGFLPQYADATRADAIADRVLEQNADIVTLVEVWDEEMADIITAKVSGSYQTFFTNETDEIDDFLTSGLMLLVKNGFTLDSANEIPFQSEIDGGLCEFAIIGCLPCVAFGPTPPGLGCLAAFCVPAALECMEVIEAFGSKGYIEATITTPEGFAVRTYSTHAAFGWDEDAGALDEDEFEIRRNQLTEITTAAAAYRAANPDHAVIIMGDFNAIEAAPFSEYEPMLPSFIAAGTNDGALNAPCYDASQQYTAKYDENELMQHFEEDEDLWFNQRLDYYFYSPRSVSGNVEIVPKSVQVGKFMSDAPITDGDEIPGGTKDLSDHYALIAEYDLLREASAMVAKQKMPSPASETDAASGGTRLSFVGPNPFMEATTIHFNLGQPGPVLAQVFDVRGRLVRSLDEAMYPAGSNRLQWDGLDQAGRGIASGVYYLRLIADGRVFRGRVLKLR